jgi:cytochrome c biogenesis protein
MAIATLIPQRASEEAYLKAFGTVLGPLIAKTTLHNIYGSWWFIGAFALLAVNLLVCSVRRARQILLQDLSASGRPASEAELRGRQTRWRIPHETDAAAGRLDAVLRHAGYSVAPPLTGNNGEYGLVARKGRLSLWSPVITHIGMVIVLVGAAWGRMPSHTYRATAMLGPGEVFAAQPPGEAFGLRLNDAGAEHDSSGKPRRYWAELDVLEEGRVVRSQTVEPNRPLRYHGVSVVLQSIMPAGYQIAVEKGNSVGTVPVALSEGGQISMMGSLRRLEDPPWVVFVHSFRDKDEAGHEAPAARVFVDRSGELSHNWQLVGWVGADGLDYDGVHFRLMTGMSGTQLSLDRDVGVPVVYLGFILVSVGTILMLGPPHRRVTALVRAGGRGSRIALSVSPGSDQREAKRLGSSIESDLGGVREADPVPAKEESCVS